MFAKKKSTCLFSCTGKVVKCIREEDRKLFCFKFISINYQQSGRQNDFTSQLATSNERCIIVCCITKYVLLWMKITRNNLLS